MSQRRVRRGVQVIPDEQPYQYVGWATIDGWLLVEESRLTREATRAARDEEVRRILDGEKAGVERTVKAGQPTTGATT